MIPRLVTIIFATLLAGGCSTLEYYAQSINGHMELMAKRQPVDRLRQDPETPESLRQRLLQLEAMRDFASASLSLPDNDSYRSFVQLEREAVVWAVVAAAEFSIEPITWCYPLIGCASYRGYFSKQEAQAFGQAQRKQGMEVAVEPVPAYSTLGWFDDPVTSSVVEWPEARLAGLIFHELAHQQLYLPGDSAFNEGFATLVEREGVLRWLQGESNHAALDAWWAEQDRELSFVALLMQTRKRLGKIYQLPVTEQQKRRRKADEFWRLSEEYQNLKALWGGFDGYDAWFEHEPNNARLASVATYEQWVPAFRLLLVRAGGGMEEFYQACDRLAQLPAARRREEMESLRAAALEAGLDNWSAVGISQ